VKTIADTGLFVALLNRRDRFHGWATGLLPQLEAPFLTCESVLSETAFHVRSSEIALSLVHEGLAVVSLDLAKEWQHLFRLARRYADQEPDLADLCLVRLSEQNPDHVVVTIDAAHFRVYRRNKREAIPLLSPPDL
jgi:predicted nucleic acid-binding protein